MEDVLLPHSERRFRQHQETPFGTGERSTKLGLDCTSGDAKALLNRLYDRKLEQLTKEARCWLKQLQRQPFTAQPDGEISSTIEVDEWIAGWSKMLESTASAPGGHYGHYKTPAVAAKLDEKHQDYFPELAETYAAMASLPLKHGFALKRWGSCIDAVLEKIPGPGRRTLGVRIAPSENWNDEYDFRRKQGHELSFRMAGSSLAKYTARLGYRTMVCPALEYPLTVTQFIQEHCDTITSPILRSCMSQMGYNQNSPKEVVYGPVELGGFGLRDLFIEQGIHQVTALVGHLREKKSKTGNMMKIELDWCHLQAGTGDHLLEILALKLITSRHVGSCLFVIFCACTTCVWSLRNAVTQ
jgi:hypothetical protein